MMMLWAWAGVPLGVYNIAEGFNVALRIQPQILTLLSLVTWIQCYYYERVCIQAPMACVDTGHLTLTEMDYSPFPHGCRAGCLCNGWS
jgi:hypothetical protein